MKNILGTFLKSHRIAIWKSTNLGKKLSQHILMACIWFKQPKNRVKNSQNFNLDAFLSESFKTFLALCKNSSKELFKNASVLHAKTEEKGEIV